VTADGPKNACNARMCETCAAKARREEAERVAASQPTEASEDEVTR